MKNILYFILFIFMTNANASNNVLVINSSPRGENSVSRKLTAEMSQQILIKYPKAQIIQKDLSKNPVPHLTNDEISAFFTPIDKRDDNMKKTLELSDALTQEILNSDLIIIGAPMWNFSIPSVLKAWIDKVVRVGLTFKYTDTGVVGLLSNKTKVIILISSGDFYSSGDAQKMDHEVPYLKTIFGFMGITDIEVVRAEGLSKSDEIHNKSVKSALEKIDEIVKNI